MVTHPITGPRLLHFSNHHQSAATAKLEEPQVLIINTDHNTDSVTIIVFSFKNKLIIRATAK